MPTKKRYAPRTKPWPALTEEQWRIHDRMLAEEIAITKRLAKHKPPRFPKRGSNHKYAVSGSLPCIGVTEAWQARDYRAKHGYSYRKMARILEVSQKTAYYMLTGQGAYSKGEYALDARPAHLVPGDNV